MRYKYCTCIVELSVSNPRITLRQTLRIIPQMALYLLRCVQNPKGTQFQTTDIIVPLLFIITVEIDGQLFVIGINKKRTR